MSLLDLRVTFSGQFPSHAAHTQWKQGIKKDTGVGNILMRVKAPQPNYRHPVNQECLMNQEDTSYCC